MGFYAVKNIYIELLAMLLLPLLASPLCYAAQTDESLARDEVRTISDFSSRFETLALENEALQGGLCEIMNLASGVVSQGQHAQRPSAKVFENAMLFFWGGNWSQAEYWLNKAPAAPGKQLLLALLAMARGDKSAGDSWLAIYEKEPQKSLIVLHFFANSLYPKNTDSLYNLAICLASNLNSMDGWQENKITEVQVKSILQYAFHVKVKDISHGIRDFPPEKLDAIIQMLKKDPMIVSFKSISPDVVYVLEVVSKQSQWHLYGALIFEDLSLLDQKILISFPSEPIFCHTTDGTVSVNFK